MNCFELFIERLLETVLGHLPILIDWLVSRL